MKSNSSYHQCNRFQGFDFGDFNEKNFVNQIKNSQIEDNNDSINLEIKNQKIYEEMYQSIHENDGIKSKNQFQADRQSINTPRYSISMEIKNNNDSTFIINMSE